MVNCFMARSQTNLQFEGSENAYYPTKVELTSGVKTAASLRKTCAAAAAQYVADRKGR